MNKKNALLLILQFFALSIFSQSTIKGKVTDESGLALGGATVVVENTFKGAYSGIDGSFEIKGLKKGTYSVKVSFIGYQTLVKSVNADESDLINFPLKRSAIMTEEVIISATRAGEKVPATYSNVEKEAISSQNLGQDIPYMLSLTPSLVTNSDAGAGVGYTSFRIRGTDATRINVTVNGIPVNDSESHGVWWVNMPDFVSSIDNLQIQRGVGTSTNGAASFGATINMQTLTLKKDAYAEINSSAGSFNTLKNTVSVGSGLINNKFTFDARLSQIQSDGYIDRAKSNLKSFFLSGGYYGEKSILKINVFSGKEKTYQAWDGVPSYILDTNRTYNGIGQYTAADGSTQYYDNETDNYQQDHYQMVYSSELTEHFNLNLALHYTKGRGYYEQYKSDRDFADYLLPNQIVGIDTIESTDLIQRKMMDNDFYGGTFSLSYKKSKLDALIGGGWNRYIGDHYGKIIWAQYATNAGYKHQWYYSRGDKKDYNVFAKMNYQLTGLLHAYADLQYRGIDYDIEGTDGKLRYITQSHIFSFFNPKAGLFYDINDNQNVYISYGVAHREPTRSNFTDSDVSKPSPKAERLNDYELGYTHKSNKWQLKANLYYMDYKDQLVLTGEINDVGDPIMANVKKSYRTGIEISTGVKLSKMINWDVNATYSQNKIQDFTEYVDNWDTWAQDTNKIGLTDIAFSPNIVANSKISVEPVKNLVFSLITTYVGLQYIDNTANKDRMLDAYLLNNIQLSYKFSTKWFKECALNLMVNNILSEEYETNAWIYRYNEGGANKYMDGYFPQAGINFLAGVNLRF